RAVGSALVVPHRAPLTGHWRPRSKPNRGTGSRAKGEAREAAEEGQAAGRPLPAPCARHGRKPPAPGSLDQRITCCFMKARGADDWQWGR
ncbi:unnamed protein product, partial [Ectocarpus sp. 12 AP-2014]